MIIKKIYTIDSPMHLLLKKYITRGRSYVSWISNYLCNQCLSPVKLWVWTPLRRGVLNTTLCDKVCQWLATGRWFSQGTPVSSTNKTDRHDITEILLKVALSTINQPFLFIEIYHDKSRDIEFSAQESFVEYPSS